MSRTAYIRSIFRYSWGRASGSHVSFSIVSRVLNTKLSQTQGRLVLRGFIGDASNDLTSSVQTKPINSGVGSWKLGYGETKPDTILHFKVETIRGGGGAANMSEFLVVLDPDGPVLEVTAHLPPSPDFPSDEISIFEGAGWILDDGLMEVYGLQEAAERQEDTLWWPNLSEEWDQGIFGVVEKESSRGGGSPQVVPVVEADGSVKPTIGASRRRRRIKVR